MNSINRLTAALAIAFAANTATAGDGRTATVSQPSETEGYTLSINTENAGSKLIKDMKPTVRFGGYIMGKYSISDRSKQELLLQVPARS